MDVDATVLRKQQRAIGAAERQLGDSRHGLGCGQQLEPRTGALQTRRGMVEKREYRPPKQDHYSRGLKYRILAKARGRITQKAAAQDLQLLHGRIGIQLDQRRRAAAGRVIRGLLLALEYQDIGEAALGEKVGQRRTGDSGTDDDHFKAAALVHVGHSGLDASAHFDPKS